MKLARVHRFSRPLLAERTAAAGRAQPRHPDAVARARSRCNQDLSAATRADYLVAGDPGQRNAWIELAVDQVQIGAAHRAGQHPQQQLTLPRDRIRHLARHQRPRRSRGDPFQDHGEHGPMVRAAPSPRKCLLKQTCVCIIGSWHHDGSPVRSHGAIPSRSRMRSCRHGWCKGKCTRGVRSVQ